MIFERSKFEWQDGWKPAEERTQRTVDKLGWYERHLDVGCSYGFFTKQYLRKYPSTTGAYGTGVDISEAAIIRANNPWFPMANFITADVYRLPFYPWKTMFNFIHCAETLEHLERPADALAEMLRFLKPGGDIYISVPGIDAAPWVEHLWRWDHEGFKANLLKDLKVIDEGDDGHIMYFLCQKSV